MVTADSVLGKVENMKYEDGFNVTEFKNREY
jgi:hypothetical protein